MKLPLHRHARATDSRIVRSEQCFVRTGHGATGSDTPLAGLDTPPGATPRGGRAVAALLLAALLLLGDAALGGTRLAAADGWLIEQWTSADGLPLDHAMDIARTPDGTLWIATFGGLVRFDGARFEALGPSELPGLRTSRISALAVHPDDGALWIMGDHGQGIYRLLDDRLEVWDQQRGFPATNRLSKDAEGLWLATSRGLYALTDRPEQRFSEQISGFVNGTVLDPDGTRWIAADGAVLRRSPDGEVARLGAAEGVPEAIGFLQLGPGGAPMLLRELETIPLLWDGARFAPRASETTRGAGWVVTLDTPLPAGGPGSPWSLSTAGIHQDGRLVAPFDGRVTSTLYEPDGGLWLTTLSAGLLWLHPSRFRVVRSGDTDEQVSAVFIDPEGALWLRGMRSWWTPTPEGPTSLLPGRASQDGYLFSDGEGLQLARSEIHAIRGDGAGSHAAEPVAPLALAYVLSSHVDPDGRRWLGDRSGLFVREGGAWAERRGADGQPIREVRAMLDHPEGGLLLASAGRGLLWLDPSGEVSRLDAQSGAVTDNPRHLRIAGDRLWISTEDAGLCAAPLAAVSAAPWRCVGADRGLPAPGAHVSVPDDLGRIWVSTNRGIAVARGEALDAFARGEREDVAFLTLGVRDGMASAEANGGNDLAFARDEAGWLWFPTQRGAAGLDPARFTLPEAPTARIDGLYVGEERAPAERLSLPADHPPVRVRWSVAASPWDEQALFRVRVGDGPWSKPDRVREATFAALPPGDVQIEVQASLAGAWGPIASASLARAPLPYERRGAPFVAVVLGLALAGIGIWIRERTRRVRERELEAEVAARTAELAESADVLSAQKDQLAAQAARLEQLDALRTRMIVNLHHELRTPLSLVVGPLDELLLESPGGERARRCGEVAMRNARELEKLVDQLFDLTRLEAGELPILARRIDIGALARRALDRLARLAAQGELALRPPDGAPTPIWCDPDLIDKALGNLIHNAIKFTPPGGEVAVTVAVEGDWIRIDVLDGGPGVDEADRERIFERLFQADRGDGRRRGGAGLGLALAREVVELHGGRIGVQPRSGGGSAFWFTLPAKEPPHSLEEIALTPGPDALTPPEPEPLQGEGALALVVEDHPDMRAFLAAQLSSACRVVTAPGGSEALALARAERPDLVVSDVMMPGMTGLELARALRSDAALASVPILLVSAKAAVEDRVAGLEVADDYLVKPFRVTELRARARRLLARAPGDSPPPPAGEAAPPSNDPEAPIADREALERLERIADERLADVDFGVAALAGAAAMSERTLRRELKRLTGVSPATWLRERRLEAGRRLLASGAHRTVSEVAAAVGMSRSYFSRAYAAWAGRTPVDDLLERGAP